MGNPLFECSSHSICIAPNEAPVPCRKMSAATRDDIDHYLHHTFPHLQMRAVRHLRTVVSEERAIHFRFFMVVLAQSSF